MTQRKVYEVRADHGDVVCRVYRDSETRELICKLTVNGQRQEAADYFTDDRDDAYDTAQAMVAHVMGE